MVDFPPPPANTIDWANMESLRVHEVNGHIESTFLRSTGKWTPLKFVVDPYVRLHGLSPGLNYGQQALEGFKAFRMPGNPGRITLFRPDRNAMRFQLSAKVLSMPAVPVDFFIHACRAAVALNAEYVPPHTSGGGLYVRPLVYGSSARLVPSAPDEYTFCVFVIPTGSNDHGSQAAKALILDQVDRAALKGVGHAKVGGNYAPIFNWTDKARAEGFGMTLHLDSARHEEVDEFSTCGFIGVRSDAADDSTVTLVIPDSPCVIDSVTSDSVQRIGRSFGWPVEKRRVRYTELPDFSEVLGAGTGVALLPIRSITRRRETGAGHLPASPRVWYDDDDTDTVRYLSDDEQGGGRVYEKLLAQLKKIQLGQVPDEFGWRSEVRAEDGDVDGAH